MNGSIGRQFPSRPNSLVLRWLDGKRLFHVAAKYGIELFDKEIFVVIAHNMLVVCIYFAVGGACGLFKRMLNSKAASLGQNLRTEPLTVAGGFWKATAFRRANFRRVKKLL